MPLTRLAPGDDDRDVGVLGRLGRRSISVGPVDGGSAAPKCTSSPRNVLNMAVNIGTVVATPAAAAIGE